MHDDERLEPVGHGGDAVPHVVGAVLGGELARLETQAARRGPRETIDPEAAPILAAPIPCDEIPPAALVDERVRLDLAAARGSVAALVAEPKPLAVAAGGRNHG